MALSEPLHSGNHTHRTQKLAEKHVVRLCFRFPFASGNGVEYVVSALPVNNYFDCDSADNTSCVG